MNTFSAASAPPLPPALPALAVGWQVTLEGGQSWEWWGRQSPLGARGGGGLRLKREADCSLQGALGLSRDVSLIRSPNDYETSARPCARTWRHSGRQKPHAPCIGSSLVEQTDSK